MKRRNFIELITLAGGVLASGTAFSNAVYSQMVTESFDSKERTYEADVIIAGAGLGGFAATMAALRNGLSVILTEETDWIGGQLTQQGLSCPDEHPWIETHGATQMYRDFRTAVREYYLKNLSVVGFGAQNTIPESRWWTGFASMF